MEIQGCALWLAASCDPPCPLLQMCTSLGNYGGKQPVCWITTSAGLTTRCTLTLWFDFVLLTGYEAELRKGTKDPSQAVFGIVACETELTIGWAKQPWQLTALKYLNGRSGVVTRELRVYWGRGKMLGCCDGSRSHIRQDTIDQ